MQQKHTNRPTKAEAHETTKKSALSSTNISSASWGMQICVRTFTKIITVTTRTEGTIRDIKTAIEHREGTPAADQLLTWGGKMLRNDRSLASYKLINHSTVNLTLRLRGGPAISRPLILASFFDRTGRSFGTNSRTRGALQFICETLRSPRTETPGGLW